LCHIQTDGSFHHRLQISRTAVLIVSIPPISSYERVATYYDHENCYESEWVSVLDGLKLARSLDMGGVQIENDNMGVISILKGHEEPNWSNQTNIREHFYEITQLANEFDWVEVRWIPREINYADTLFKKFKNLKK
jgi:ribonuclease HI